MTFIAVLLPKNLAATFILHHGNTRADFLQRITFKVLALREPLNI